MADSPTQDEREGRLATPLGKDKLLLTRFEGAEGMGELFEFQIEALSLDGNINFDHALGLNSSVHLETHDGAGRDFSGVLTQARWLGKRGELFAYSLVLRPWLWLLSLTSDCRIFPNMDPKQIIKQVFEDRHFSDIIDLTSGDYPTLEYTVQYRETDLNFVLRLMEEYGIYYYFQFMPGDGSSPSIHYLVLADSTTHVSLPNPTEVIYLPPGADARRDVQQFNDWTKSRAMVTGVFAVNDYDYEKPGASLLSSSQFGYQFAHGDMEIYNYPGSHKNQNEGMKLAGVTLDAERTRNQNWSASGYAPSLTPGFTIKRTSSSGDPEDGSYLLLRCSHAYGPQTYESDDSGDGGAGYVGSYELSRSEIPYRMPARTRKPVIVGTQSALVVTKEKEEIDVDKQGRVLVQFYWDRKKSPSRRVRVAQFWAGSQRGALFLPRVGDEVLVQYEEGDPDRPIVVGSVYNGDNPQLARLPKAKPYSGIITKSTKNSTGYNMLLFDDTAGDEHIKLRAQRDLMFKALRNEQRDINGSQTENIGGDETITVGGPKGGGDFSLEAAKSIDLSVKKGSSEIDMDADSIQLTVGTSVIFMNKSGITLQATPASSIKIEPSGITIMTPQLTLTALAAVTITAPATNINPILNCGVMNAVSGTVAGALPLL